MTATLARPPSPLQFLQSELAPFPGRLNIMLRCLAASALVIVTSMTLEVPYLVLSLFMVFCVTQANIVLTRLIGIMFVIGSTLSIAILVLMFQFTFNEPFLRILAASALFFASVYLSRVTKIGIVFFSVAIVAIYGQSFVDLTPSAEFVVRQILWVWVAVNYAVAITLVINTLFLPMEPVVQLRGQMARQMELAGRMLAARAGEAPVPLGSPEPRQAAVTLLKLSRFATMRSDDYREREGWQLVRIAAVSRLYRDAWELLQDCGTAVSKETLAGLRRDYARLETVVADESPFTLAGDGTEQAVDNEGAIVADIRHSLRELADHDAYPAGAKKPRHGKENILLPDAFSNKVYVQFSLKALLAALIAYVFYKAVDWTGIHTILLTTLIVAQPSLGATTRRSLLRIVGAVIGSLLALFMVVFVVPQLDDIVGLLAISLPVIAAGAWITAGSERISYAGTQLMFTFAMSLLTQFAPTSDLTEIRDRIVGIALGVGLSLFIHTNIAPETEGEALRRRLAELIRVLASLLRFPVGSTPLDRLNFSKQKLAALANYEDCEALLGRVTLEPDWQAGNTDQEDLTLYTQAVLSQAWAIRRVLTDFKSECAGRVDTAPSNVKNAVVALEAEIAAALDRYADCLAEHPADTRSPPAISLDKLARQCRRSEESGDSAPGSHDVFLARAADLVGEIARLPNWAVLRPDDDGQWTASPA